MLSNSGTTDDVGCVDRVYSRYFYLFMFFVGLHQKNVPIEIRTCCPGDFLMMQKLEYK